MVELSLPLFPLQTVLFPGGLLPLRIFEVRYLDLMGRCQKEGAPFGVVCMTRGSEVRQPPRHATESGEDFELEAFHNVGTLAQIVAYERIQPGLVHVRCSGGRRFKLIRSEQLRHGLWIGQAQWIADDANTAVPPDLMHVRQALQNLEAHLTLTGQLTLADPVRAPLRWDDCGWVANRWCELLPISASLKQQLMALDNPLLRLELVSDLLERLKIAARPAAT